MKRILCIILAVLLLIPSAYAAGENMSLTISQVQGEVGDTVTITGQVTNAPACTSFRVILTYDSACLKITGGSIGPKVKGGYINTAASFGGKKAISALSADATKSFEGDVVLFTLTAEIVGTPASGDSTALAIAHYEFFDTSANLQKVTPATVTDGSLTYPSLKQPAGGNDNTGSGDNNTGDNNTGNNNPGSGDNNNNNTGDNNTGNNPGDNNTNTGDNNTNTGDNNTNTGDNNTNTGDNNTNTGDNNTNTGDNNTNTGDNNTNTGDNNTNTGDNNTNTGDNNTNTGAGEGNTGNNESADTPAPETDKKPSADKNDKNDKTPTGDWIVVEDQFAHIDENGNSNLYEGEYEEPKNPGDKADVILKDEDGNTVGSVVIEKDEAGNLNVIEQDLNNKKPMWPWVAGGVALALAAAAVAVVLILKKKKETVSEDASYIP